MIVEAGNAAAQVVPPHSAVAASCGITPLLDVRDVTKTFPAGSRARVHALSGVSLIVRRGETLGIVGESGCGKSTLARCLVRLYDIDSGAILFDGTPIGGLRGTALRGYNRRVQMVFQDPYGSLNPRMTVAETLAEPFHVHRLCAPREVDSRVATLLDLVHLPRAAAGKRPHEFSGGQRQRIGIARALSVSPECLIADELVSALDVSVQAQIVNLLLELQEQLGLTVIFIAHDLRLVRHLSHRVAVMYLGRIVELAETEALFRAPRHPYTQGLLAAAPDLDPTHRHRAAAVRGELPSPIDVPPGCAFHPRCSVALPRCSAGRPDLLAVADGRLVACHVAAASDG